MSTAADIWEVMAAEISSPRRNPLEMFLGRAGLHGVSTYRRRGRAEPAVAPRLSLRVAPRTAIVPLVGFTMNDARAGEARGEGTIRFVGGVPTWLATERPAPAQEPDDVRAVPPQVA